MRGEDDCNGAVYPLHLCCFKVLFFGKVIFDGNTERASFDDEGHQEGVLRECRP